MTALAGKRVLIVGGSSGIGFAVAEQALAEGASVTIASRSLDKLDAAVSALGPDVTRAVLDSRDLDALETFQPDTRWDHVVVSAAQTESGSLRQMPVESARESMESKFWGAYNVARALRIVEGGSLTFISGAWGLRPSAGAVVQGAINAALEGLARGLALELSPTRVNCVSPGLIDTPIWSGMDDAARRAMYERAAASLPARIVGRADDIANAVLFLMKTPFATAATLRVDGGAAIA